MNICINKGKILVEIHIILYILSVSNNKKNKQALTKITTIKDAILIEI